MLVVIDTNLLISSLLTKDGWEAKVVNLVRDERLRAAVTYEMLAEYRTTLERPKFKFSPLSIDRILITFTRFGEFVNPEFTLAVSRHEPDNRFLECAEAAGANYLITGNLRHYPSQHGVTRIVRAPTFLSETQFLFQL